MLNPADIALRKQTLMVVLTLLLGFAGLLAYSRLGRLEDPAFTIKTALVVTPYPGASPAEVEEEVTDVLEEAIQQMGQLDKITSTSREGLSVIYAEMKPTYKSAELPQIWDELRRKIGDAQGGLPPGAGPSAVRDDFGDVYGVFFAVTGSGHDYRGLEDYAEELKKDLLRVDGVAKIALWGVRREVIYVEMERAKMARLGMSPAQIFGTLQSQNLVSPSGKVRVGDEYVRITPTGDFTSEDAIGDLVIGGAGSLVRLRDVATVRRGYEDPPRQIMRFDGQPAVGLGISTVQGGNVIDMGAAVRHRLAELDGNRPVGMEIHVINYQSDNVSEAVHLFVTNLVEAVAIVIVLLMVFMGWQSGMLIGVILLLNILGTFVAMKVTGIDLQKISLGALILALGMLVDNAIVVADGILVKVERGEDRETAAREIVRDTQWPLLGATLVAILAFAAIAFAPGNVGEYCRSLFDVMGISLLLSWVLAVTVTPLLCVRFLKIPDIHGANPYDRRMFRVYRRFLHGCIRYRALTIAATAGLLVLAMVGFRHIPQFFFPGSTRPQFMLDYWRPGGTHIEQTAQDLERVEAFLDELPGVESVTTFVGEGALRFILPYDYQSPDTSFGQLLVRVDDYRRIDDLLPVVDRFLTDNFPDAEPKVKRIANGPPVPYRIEARFRGPDTDVLRDLTARAKRLMREDPGGTVGVRDDWRTRVTVLRPRFSQERARRTGITRSDLARALQWTFGGLPVGLYREGDDLVPIVSRPPKGERESVTDLRSIQVWSPSLNVSVPLAQVAEEVDTVREDPIIHRRDRVRTITAQCDPAVGLASPLFERLRPAIEAIPLPTGYSLEWGGEFEASNKGKDPLRKTFPLCLLGMFVIVVGLFNSVRKPVIIFLCVPLAIIGVTAGLLVFRLPFGFMAILGFLGLSGMLIKNAIVLIDQIELELNAGAEPYRAVLDSAVSRLRPVTMAAGTTVLGMAPLIPDPFYSVMAATIMSGLVAATALTLIVVPVLYTLFFRIRPRPECV